MPSTLNRIIESFPHPTILAIVGQPTYETLAEVHLKLNTNAASVQSNLGNGLLGLLFLTVTLAVYNTQSAIAFIPPANPGPAPIIPAHATGPQIADLCRHHDVTANLYKEYDLTDKALKSLLISAVDETYVRSLRDKYIGYANITTLQMLTHLYTAYAKISESDLQANDEQMKVDYDVNQPIEVLINQIDDAVNMAAAANNPYTPSKSSPSPTPSSLRWACLQTIAKSGNAWRHPSKPGQNSSEFSLWPIRAPPIAADLQKLWLPFGQ
jgi:hypothetical protein